MKLTQAFFTTAQLGLLCALLWSSNQLVAYFHLPLPGAILGLGILLMLLISDVLPEKMVALGGGWLLTEMLLFFIPPCVSLLKYLSLVERNGLGLLTLLFIGTVTVMTSTALVVDQVYRFETRRQQHYRSAPGE